MTRPDAYCKEILLSNNHVNSIFKPVLPKPFHNANFMLQGRERKRKQKENKKKTKENGQHNNVSKSLLHARCHRAQVTVDLALFFKY